MQRATVLATENVFRDFARKESILFARLPVSYDLQYWVVFKESDQSLGCTCSFTPKPCVHAHAFGIWIQGKISADTDEVPVAVQVLIGQAVVIPNGANGPDLQVAKDQRRLERLDRAGSGFIDLEKWLDDTMRQGIATVTSENPTSLIQISARLADASLTNLSRQFRLAAQVSSSDPNWSNHMAQLMGDMYFICLLFKSRFKFSDGFLADLQTAIGISARNEEALGSGITNTDTWWVWSAQEYTIESDLKGRKTWVQGVKSGQYAYIQDYAFQGIFAPGITPGTQFQDTLYYYPSAYPLRVMGPEEPKRLNNDVNSPVLSGYKHIEDMLEAYASALKTQPLLRYFPAQLTTVKPINSGTDFFLTDIANQLIITRLSSSLWWRLVAISGGNPVQVFGEWDGAQFQPLGVVSMEGDYYRLY